MQFIANIDLVPKGRPRIGRNGHAYTPTRTRQNEIALACLLQSQMKTNLITDKIKVKMKIEVTHNNGDIDNYAKLVGDAGNKRIWVDDKQITELHIQLKRGASEGKLVMDVEPIGV